MNNLIHKHNQAYVFYTLQIKKLFNIAIWLVAFSSCHEKVKTKPIISIIVENIPQMSGKYQEKVSNFTFVPLETKDESLIQYIKKVTIYDNKIYILDDQRPLFAIFTIDGKFIRSVGKKGNGPGEFYFPSDFLIDSLHKQIEVYDGLRDRILIYNLNGNFLKRIPVPVRGDYFVKFTNEDYIVYTNMRNEKEMTFKLARIDKSGKLVSKELAYTAKTNQTLFSPFVHISKDEFILSEYNCDTIFRINPKEVIPWVYIDMGKEGMPYEYRLDFDKASNNAQKYSQKAGSPMILGNQLIVKYSKNWNPKYLFYNLLDNSANYFKVTNTYDLAFGTPSFSSNNKMVGVIQTTSLNLHKTNPQYALQYQMGEKIPQIENFRKNMKLTDNPCLVIWTLNKTDK